MMLGNKFIRLGKGDRAYIKHFAPPLLTVSMS